MRLVWVTMFLSAFLLPLGSSAHKALIILHGNKLSFNTNRIIMDYLLLLKTEIERRFGRQPESPVDYNDLALNIQRVTGKEISSYTLMRIWGHVKNTSSPRQDTLSNLARYAGYAGWADFVEKKNQEAGDGAEVKTPMEALPEKKAKASVPPSESKKSVGTRPSKWLRKLIAAFFFILIGIAVGILISRGISHSGKYAQETGIVVSEKGDELSWTLDMGNWALTITGKGKMKDFSLSAPAEAWLEYRDSLRSVVIGEGITHIGTCAFWHCPLLASAKLPKSCTSIGDNAFDGCSVLSDITLPDGLTQLGRTAFWGCQKLKKIVIPAGVTRIGSQLFCNCTNLESCTILGPITNVESYAFAECGALGQIELPEGVTRIGTSAFSNCRSLQEMNVPEGVTRILQYAFHNCSSLTEVTLPSTLTNIGPQAFECCTSLRHIDCRAIKAPDLGGDVFIGIPSSTIRLTYPEGANYTSWLNALP